jgi:hypothetical protein
LSVRICMWMCIVMEEHYTGCQHSTPFVLNGPTQFFFHDSQCTSDIIVIHCCINFTIIIICILHLILFRHLHKEGCDG